MDKPVYTTAQILSQLQTSWGSGDTSYRVWNKASISYFIGSATVVGDDKTGESAGWTAMQADQTAAAAEAFAIWNELISGAQFVPTTTASTADVTIAYSSTTTKGGTYGNPSLGPLDPLSAIPTKPLTHEAIWLSTGFADLQTGQLGLSSQGFETYLHEIGHALGLSHPGPYDASAAVAPTYDADAVFKQDTQQYSIMSYFGSDFQDGWKIAGGGYYSSTPMLYDIMAIQQKYGANFTTRNGDTVYGYNSNAGRDFYDFTTNTSPVFTIWDGGGNDTIDASGYGKAQKIDLTPGAYSSVLGLTDNIAIAFNPSDTSGGPGDALIENAIGGSGNDVLLGNYGNNRLVGNDGNDTLYGLTGADTLIGGNGDDILDGGGTGNGIYANLADTLTGGAGHDTFVYSSGYHNTTITDFSVADDVLDLSGETKVQDLAGLLSYAHQDGADLVFDFGASGTSRDALRLQNVTLSAFAAINPLSVAVTATSASAGITITPTPSQNLDPMYVSVAPLAGGGFVATRFSSVDVATRQILAFRYDATGTLVDSVQVNVGPSDAGMVRAIGLSSGLTVVVWASAAGGDGGSPAVRARLLDATGTPIGGEFTVNKSPFAVGGGSLDLSLTASPGGGADVEYYVPSTLRLNGNETFFAYRAGIHPDGSVGDENNLGTTYRGTIGSNTSFNYAFRNYDYFVQFGTDGREHAFYQKAGATPVQIDTGDFFPDGVGLDQPPFQVIQLTDGRIMFSYLSGLFEGTQQFVLRDKVVILNADGTGFIKVGTDANDYLQGGAGNDQLIGKGGDDVLQGMAGGDVLDGGAGSDTAAYTRSPVGVTVDLGIAGPQGGAGDAAGDTLVSIENLVGSAFDDTLSGDAGANRIDGGAGNDVINGNGGSDMLLGGAGNDTITLTADVAQGGPVPEAHGGDGNDIITINGNLAAAYGDAGDDRITINGDHSTADGGTGDDTITVAGNGNTVNGGPGNNTLAVLSGNGNVLEGGPGHDLLEGGPGDDILRGNGGNDTYSSSGGHDSYSGGPGDFLLYGSSIANFLLAYDPVTGTLTISDTRPGAPEGVATVDGIDGFSFKEGNFTLAQLEARVNVPTSAGRVADGYVAGATVFADANGDFVRNAGEATTVTDGFGRFVLPTSLSRLVAVGGTDIATGLALTLPLTAPAGYATITALSTLVDALGGGVQVSEVLGRLNLDTSIDLAAADPVAGIGGSAPYALFVANTKLMDTFALLSAFVASVRGTTVPAAFGQVLGAFTAAYNAGVAFDLGAPDMVGDVLNRALVGAGANMAEATDVVTAIVASNTAADAAATATGIGLLRAESAVAMAAQGGLATALTGAGSAADVHAAMLAFTGPALGTAIAANLLNVGNADGAPCYTLGTLIRTEFGDVPVEALAIGDRVVTRDGTAKPIRWIGRRSYGGRFLKSNPKVHPVRFSAGSLGAGLPRRDLLVSPCHAMFLDGVLVPAALLVNGGTIARQRNPDRVDYFHVELDAHDVILAEGAESETFVDDHSRGLFQNAFEYDALYPEAPQPGGYCAPRVESGFALEAIRRRLAAGPGLATERK